MSDGVAEQVKKFLFKSRNNRTGENDLESLEVFIPEVLSESWCIWSLFYGYKLIASSCQRCAASYCCHNLHIDF
jgi:hypothetical protein